MYVGTINDHAGVPKSGYPFWGPFKGIVSYLGYKRGATILGDAHIMYGFPKIRVPFWGVPRVRIRLFWGI